MRKSARQIATAFYDGLCELILADAETAYNIGECIQQKADKRALAVAMLDKKGLWIVQERDGMRTELCCSFPQHYGAMRQALSRHANAEKRAQQLARFLALDVPDLMKAYHTMRNRFDYLTGCGYTRNDGFTALPHDIRPKPIRHADGTRSQILAPSQDLNEKIAKGKWWCMYRAAGHREFCLEFTLDYAESDLQVTLNSKGVNGLRMTSSKN